MRLLILDENYPHLDNLMGDVFVHVRAKAYAAVHEVTAFAYFNEPKKLVYEGIPVQVFDQPEKLLKAIEEYVPDRILIHFYKTWMLEKVIKQFKVPVIIWVHGYEALGWYRRLFNFKLYSPVLLNYVFRNTKQQLGVRRLIRFANRSSRVKFVFVSDWMRKITETDTATRIKNRYVIPNPIDTRLFRYVQKEPADAKKILLLRSFGSRKYANDMAIKAILKLSVTERFHEYSFTIMGDGHLFDEMVKPLRDFSNISIHKGAVRQVNIPEIHRQHGVFLCPTRQDAQGVSMCEAMSSGLVPITSNNTAIPEFVENGRAGMLTNNVTEIVKAFEYLASNEQAFLEMSSQASESIRQQCNIDAITTRELQLIES